MPSFLTKTEKAHTVSASVSGGGSMTTKKVASLVENVATSLYYLGRFIVSYHAYRVQRRIEPHAECGKEER
jgi:hypothetical protein